MTSIAEDSFKPIIKLLRLSGLYTDGKKSLLLKLWSYLLFLVFVWIIVSILVNLTIEENRSSMHQNISVFAAVVNMSGCCKMFAFLINESRIKTCINFFGNDRFAPRNQKEREIRENCARACFRSATIYLRLLTLSITLWFALRFFDEELPLNVYLPFDYRSTPTLFYVTFFVSVFVVLFLNTFIGQGIEPLIVGLVYQATCQIKILRYILQNLDKYIESGFNEVNFESAFPVIRRCILFHNDILVFIAEFETCFSLPVFFHFATSVLGMCYSLIGLPLTPPLSPDRLMFVIMYSMLFLQLLLYCYFGTLLYAENDQLQFSIYMGEWYKYDARIMKLLMIIMERSKKPVILTAGKIVNLNFATLTWVVKTSYSLVSVFANYH